MNMLQQTVRIFGKDLRGLRIELAGYALLLVLLVAMRAQPWDAIANSSSIPGDISELGFLLLVVAWCALSIRLIQSDSTAGKNAFWQTRPYSRAALLSAKLAFVVLCIHVPVLVAQIAILVISGLGFELVPLILNQLALAAIVTLPVLLAAALTTRMSLCIALIIVLIGGYAFTYESVIERSSIDWLGRLIAVVLFVGLSAAALIGQYRTRRTLRVAVAFASGIAAIPVLTFAVPERLTREIEYRVLGQEDRTLQFTLGAPVVQAVPRSGTIDPSRPRVSLTFAVTGAPSGSFSSGNAQIEIFTTGGDEVLSLSTFGGLSDAEFRVVFPVSLELLAAIGDTPVTAKINFGARQFRETEVGAIPMDGEVLRILGRAECGSLPIFGSPRIVCRSSIPSLGTWMADRTEGEPPSLWLRPPVFDLTLGINPIRQQSINWWPPQLTGGEPIPDPEFLPVTVNELAYFNRYSVTVENLRLADYVLYEVAP